MKRTFQCLILFACFFMVGNAQMMAHGSSSFMELESALKDRVWEHELNEVIERKNKTTSDSLILNGYKEIYSIKSVKKLEKAVNKIFSDNSYVAIQDLSNLSFVILPIKQAKEMAKGDFLQEIKPSILEEAKNGLLDGATFRLLQLQWTLKDKRYTSYALVTDEGGLFYETIGYMIVSEVGRKEE